MATLGVPNSFTNGTNADATLVNANFAAVKTFAETELVQRDGSVAFTGVVSHAAAQTMPRCSAQAKAAAGSMTVPNTGVSTLVTFPTEVWDSHTFFTAGGSTLTVPAGLGGLYLINLEMAAQTGSSTWKWELYKNGVLAQAMGVGVYSGTMTLTSPCVPTDVYTVKVSQSSAGTLDIGQVYFTIHRLSL